MELWGIEQLLKRDTSVAEMEFAWLQHLTSCLLQFWLPPHITRSQQGWLRDVVLGLGKADVIYWKNL